MASPEHLKYAKSHEWLQDNGDGSVSVGISDHAQGALGDIVFVELPEVGRELAAGESFGVVESVKAASDVYAPVSGTVLEVNEALRSAPETINSDPYEGGWLIRLQTDDGLEGLLDAAAYDALVAEG